MPITDAKLKNARKKAAENGQWALVSALDSLLQDTTSLDARINVPGAMHEAGLLPNSLALYWDEWRATAADHGLWAERCLDRLHAGDADYWAMAGLLALPLPAVTTALIQRKYKLLGVRFGNSRKDGTIHIASFAGKYQGRILAPVIELGWDGEHRLVEVSRWRAVILEQQSEVNGCVVGHGGGSYFMRAKLPHGCWRIHDEPFTIREGWLVPKAQTPLAEYP